MKPVVCIGAAIVDDSYYCLDEPSPGTSNPARHERSAGGVARNIAHHLAQLRHHVELIGHMGTDPDGEWLARECISAGIGISHSHRAGSRTGHFAAIVSPGGELFAAAADAQCENEITVEFLAARADLLANASLLLAECNLAPETLGWILDMSRAHRVPCVIDPVSAAKASRLRDLDLDQTLLITPNSLELAALTGCPPGGDSAAAAEILLDRGVRNIWIRNAARGSRLVSRDGATSLPAPRVEVLDTTGAGDAALAGWMHAWLGGKSPADRLSYGHAMAEIILQVRGANDRCVCPELLESTLSRQRKYGA